MSAERAKFVFMLQFDSIGGSNSVFVTSAEYEAFKDAPLKLVALTLGVSVPEYLSWVEMQGKVRCLGTNKNSQQCSNNIPSPNYECREWVEKNKIGGYCKIHGGEQ
jgi:hypothetical protein